METPGPSVIPGSTWEENRIQPIRNPWKDSVTQELANQSHPRYGHRPPPRHAAHNIPGQKLWYEGRYWIWNKNSDKWVKDDPIFSHPPAEFPRDPTQGPIEKIFVCVPERAGRSLDEAFPKLKVHRKKRERKPPAPPASFEELDCHAYML